MAERYSRLFTLNSGLYSPGAPVMVAAGALLQDSYSSNKMAQIKYINISQETVSSLKVCITMLDSAGHELPKPVEYLYTDIYAKRDGEFGRNVAIVLPNPGVRSFTVAVTEVLFQGGDLWRPQDGAEWVALKKRQTLEESLGNTELAVQFQVRYGNDCQYAPMELGAGLWYCTCGVINQSAEPKCHRCRRALSALKAVNIADLRSECEGRLKAEAAQAAEDKARAKKKNRKLLITFAIVVPLLILLAGLLKTVPREIAARRDYADAVALLESGEYEQAAALFTELGSYKDSAEQAVKNVPYRRALDILALAETGTRDDLALIDKSVFDLPEEEFGEGAVSALFYQVALELFTQLGDYKDSAQNAQLCKDALDSLLLKKDQAAYAAATELLQGGGYLAARDAFLALGNFEDSAAMADEALYQKALALYAFTEEYDVRYFYVRISTEADTPSVFSISKERALAIGGSDVIGELSNACGEDEHEILLEDSPSPGLQPMLENLRGLFESFHGYKDSAAYIDKLRLAGDFTRPFFQLCEAGDVYGAYDWLIAYEEEFPDRDRWLELLEIYKPFCGDWLLYSGDPRLIPLTAAGVEASCQGFNACVIVSLDQITLRITHTDGIAEYQTELTAEPGNTLFVYDGDSQALYYAAISQVDRFAYMEYTMDGNLVSSCEYSRA